MTDVNKQLCLALMHAETEKEIVDLLTEADYWEYSSAWRLLGDAENNFSTVGNQQSDPVAALVEKIVNSIDALLLGECRARGIDPESDLAPESPQHAVAEFFEDRPHGEFNPAQDGQIEYWHEDRVREIARHLTVTASGARPSEGNPSLSIADSGEGQSPDQFPNTLLSLAKSNKLRIPFVQGKFNMGGTGALQFCGTSQNFQLIVSKRRQDIPANGVEPRRDEWGFTIVRRDDPVGSERSSVYRYLAPNRAVLSFHAPAFGIFPDETTGQPHGRSSSHGTLIKLYAYQVGSSRSTITRQGGLFRRIDAALARAILPARYLDTRYPGKRGTQESRENGFGVETLLHRRRAELLEPTFPHVGEISVDGEGLTVRAYAFLPPKGKGSAGRRPAELYRSRSNAVLFLINGQTHAAQDTRFFASSRVGLDYLRQDLFVTVDCTSLSGRSREDLFMNSRDRMRDVPLRRDLVTALEEFLRDHPALQALNRARGDALRSQNESEHAVKSLVEQLLKDHPELQRVLLSGRAIRPVVDPPPPPPFKGREFPTFFSLESPKEKDGIAYTTTARTS